MKRYRNKNLACNIQHMHRAASEKNICAWME